MESIMSLAKLVTGPKVLKTYDADAASYITAVETADNQSLEQGIKEAIIEFVIGCKIRGIWNSIQNFYLFSGPRTAAGAAIPLKGISPILTSFVGNHTRENGLRRVSGTFDLNTNNNSFSQNDRHIAVYPTSIDYGSSDSNFRSVVAVSTVSGSTFIAFNSLGLNLRCNTSTNIATNQSTIPEGLIGVSILNSLQSQLFYNNNFTTLNINTVSPVSGSPILWGGSGLASSVTRLAFYSSGAGLNLRILDSLFKIYRQKVLRVLSTYSVIDSDANNYIKKIEAADNFALENNIKEAIDTLILGLKEDNIWTPIKASCIMSGAKTIDGALTALAGNNPLRFNFNPAAYRRSTGLIGIFDGVRYLDSLRANNADPQDNNHRAVYASQYSINWYIASTNVTGSDGIGAFGQSAGALQTQSRSAVNAWIQAGANTNGFLGIARNSSASYEVRGNQNTSTVNSTSLTPSTGNITIFARPGGGVNSNTDARLSFYSIGEYLNLTLLNNRLNTFMTSLSNAGI